ncbi:hypothetical protein F0L68_18195 [Solihabitans fulvus]|uniref:HipA-like kinase domain-containing protein n=1 Tax=Solihabitans fulvus TaxID=1892852 RepID=A0A5B2XDU0_9PSEU|nr:hypothetical protein F0L68_18195 [Solihabitans fulvus]
MLRTVTATRYVTPLREGGSLPGLVEADDLGMYVLKFHGAGQGRKALVAEVVVGELARRLGFRVPELVLVEVDPEMGKAEPDEEVQDLLYRSAGRNLGLDYLPGSLGFDPLALDPGPDLAARLMWLDALTLNVDRSWRNPNLLVWHGDVWLIDHGAALYFHHSWGGGPAKAATHGYDASDHVMLPFAGEFESVDRELTALVGPDLLAEVLCLVPDEWLADEPGFATPDDVRAAYAEYFTARLAAPRPWVRALEETRAARV